MIEATIANLPQLLFIDNVRDLPIELAIGEGRCSVEDLFHVFLEVLTKGIVLLYGSEDNSVELDSLGADRIATLKRKMMNAGIVLRVETRVALEGSDDQHPRVFFELCGDERSLPSYHLRFQRRRDTVSVSFDLVRR